MTYPHLKQVADYLTSMGADYCLFRERGYFLGEPVNRSTWARSLVSAIYTLAIISIDTLRLILRRIFGRYDLVIAIDNFAYITAAGIFSRVVLWSHDFLTKDEPRSRGHVQRFITYRVAASLRQHGTLIIQDHERLKLFFETYVGNPCPEDIETFLLPVSLLPRTREAAFAKRSPPVLMQIGGISTSRSRSDELLQHYQDNYSVYDLAFHGFFEPSMHRTIESSAVLPWVSTLTTAADSVYKVVDKCDIGFIAYNSTNLNFYHVARASGQLAEFLRCGKPVIALGKSSLGSMLEFCRLGVQIMDIGELTGAIQRISDDYSSYCENCRDSFEQTYNLANHLPALTEWLIERSQRTR